MHLLKWERQPSKRGNSWMGTIREPCEIKGLHLSQLGLEIEVAAAPAAYQNAQLRVATTHAPRAPLVTAWATTAVHSLPVRRYSQA